MMNIEDRKIILDREVGNYIKRGFRIISRTDTTAQLVKPKKFSLLWAFLWFLLFGIGLLVYVFYYVAKKDQTAYLEVDELGNVKIT